MMKLQWLMIIQTKAKKETLTRPTQLCGEITITCSVIPQVAIEQWQG